MRTELLEPGSMDDLDGRFEGEGLIEALRSLVQQDCLDDPAKGIARQIIARGTRSLSSKQHYVFQRDIVEVHLDMKCDWCRREIPLEEFDRFCIDQICIDCAIRSIKDD